MQPPAARKGPSSVAERYRVLLDIGRTLAGTLGSDELYEAIYRETASVMEAAGFFISLYDAAWDEATIVFYADRGEIRREVDITYPGSESEVLRTRRAVLVPERLEDRSLTILGDEGTDVTRSAVSAPMIHKGRLLGAISAQSYRPRAYQDDDLDLLQGIADIAGIAVDNALRVAELEARRREAEQIEEIGRAVTSSLDPREVLGHVVSAAASVLCVDGASVWLCDGAGGGRSRVAASIGRTEPPEGLEWEPSDELGERVIERREAVVVDEPASWSALPAAVRSHVRGNARVAVPLTVAGRVAGLLTAGSERSRRFGEGDVAVLQRLANQASVALENARLHANVQALSLTDPLTGLPNRRHLQIHLDKEVAAARRGRSLVVVLFDLDDFKRLNDTLGHVAGDDVLRTFAEILAEENRAMNLVARFGGDEFVSVLSESHMEGATHYARRVSDRVASHSLLSRHGVTVSIGLAEFDRTSMEAPDDVVRAADRDMYRAKPARGG